MALEKLKQNINEVDSAFTSIKNKIIEYDIEIPEDAHVRDYAVKIGKVYNRGYEQGRTEPIIPTVMDDRTSLAYWYQTYINSETSPIVNNEVDGVLVPTLAVSPLERLRFPSGTQDITNFSDFLKVIAIDATNGCYKTFPLWIKILRGTLDMSRAATVQYAFGSQYVDSPTSVLEEIGALENTSKITDFSYMFTNCKALKSVPNFDVSGAKTMQNMFENCKSLTTAPKLNSAKCTNHYALFMGCTALTDVSAEIDTSASLSVSSMFSGCTALKNCPSFNTSKVINFNYMFNGCRSLVNAPELDMSSATKLQNMYTNCYALKTVPFIDASNAPSLSAMFQNCVSLETVEGIRVNASTSARGAFQYCTKLRHCLFYGTIGANDFTLHWCPLLDKESLTSIINALSTETSESIVKLSLTAVNNAFETSAGAGDGNQSAEWLELTATKPNWTITLADV